MTISPDVSLGNWRFSKRDGLCRVVAPGGIDIAASGSVPGSGIAGADAFGVVDAAPPVAATRHCMRFGFRSNGFFSAEPAAHLAIGLGARWRKDNPSTPHFDGCLMGRGIAIGNISGAPNGCPESPVIQIESFRSDGNALYAQTGSPRLQEGHTYQVELSAEVSGKINYRLLSATGMLLAEHSVDDRVANIPPGLGGWWIIHVFSESQPLAEWSIEFVDLSVSWE